MARNTLTITVTTDTEDEDHLEVSSEIVCPDSDVEVGVSDSTLSEVNRRLMKALVEMFGDPTKSETTISV